MTYRMRIGAGLALSLAAHLLFLAVGAMLPDAAPVSLARYREPIVLELPPREAEQERRLVETREESEEPPDSNENISDKNAIAHDLSDVTGDNSSPFIDDSYNVDQLEEVPPPEPQAKLPTPSRPAPEPQTDAKPRTPKQAVEPVREAESPPEPEPQPEPVETAQAAPSRPMPPEPSRPASARSRGGVETRGIAGFEAHRDQLAPYLLEVRNRVERSWRAALELRYSGTTPTQAVVDCAIASDGQLVYVSVVEPGESVSYGALCKGAIEKAGPFAPFPFEVPEIYRNKNLEIRWTFSYM